MTSIKIEVSVGELIDKITILEIKSQRLSDAAQLANVHTELSLLTDVRCAQIEPSAELDALTRKMSAVNKSLWEIEDAIREQERKGDFGKRFIELARSVYHQNDDRATIKRCINELAGSKLIEEKSYSKY